jgi:hypothetical protein
MASANQSTWEEFRETINMTATELEKWLSTHESQT